MELVAGCSEGSVDVQLDLAIAPYIGERVRINRTLASMVVLLVQSCLMQDCSCRLNNIKITGFGT